MYIERIISPQLAESVIPGKVLVLYGARQVGKSTLLRHVLEPLPLKTRWVSADDIEVRDVLASQKTTLLQEFVGNNQLIVIDEAQRIPNIGINLKIIVDTMPEVRVVVTGSSSLELASKINEPLTGRKHTLTLGPISFAELAAHQDMFQARQQLEGLLRYGGYPGLLALPGDQERQVYMRTLINDYLYRDILDLGLVKKPPELQKLLRLLAHQIGSEVSFSEIGTKIGMDSKSVDRYIELLEQSFVLFRLGSFGTNLRKEVSRRQKIYFWDLGVRNALLDTFEPLEARHDVGALWENFLIAERRKKLYPNFELATDYFWRTRSGSEVDYVELEAGQPHAYEFKWGTGRSRHRQAWTNQYPKAPLQLVNQANVTDFIA